MNLDDTSHIEQQTDAQVERILKEGWRRQIQQQTEDKGKQRVRRGVERRVRLGVRRDACVCV